MSRLNKAILTGVFLLAFGFIANAAQDGPQPEEDWRLEGLGLTMKWIPPGTFLMGSTRAERDWASDPDGGQGEAEWFTDEPDPTEVFMENGYWMGQTPVTRGMFRNFVEAENYRTEAERAGSGRSMNIETERWEDAEGVSWKSPGLEQQEDHPVVYVSWNDAMAFCGWLTRTERTAGRLPEGYEYRLPGEAEWEYAARGGRRDSTRFWWGDDFEDGRGRMNGAGEDKLPDQSRWSNHYPWEDGFVYTSPVDHYGARGRNGFGLADMLGNVWEWCYDGYDPNGPHPVIWQEDTTVRMLRGASYMRPLGSLRVANRGRGQPDAPRPHRGFRIVLAKAL